METERANVFGDWLRHARGARSQSEVAGSVGMDQAEWSKWERGLRHDASPEALHRFARALGVPVTHVGMAYVGIWPDQEFSLLDPDAQNEAIVAMGELMDTVYQHTEATRRAVEAWNERWVVRGQSRGDNEALSGK